MPAGRALSQASSARVPVGFPPAEERGSPNQASHPRPVVDGHVDLGFAVETGHRAGGLISRKRSVGGCDRGVGDMSTLPFTHGADGVPATSTPSGQRLAGGPVSAGVPAACAPKTANASGMGCFQMCRVGLGKVNRRTRPRSSAGPAGPAVRPREISGNAGPAARMPRRVPVGMWLEGRRCRARQEAGVSRGRARAVPGLRRTATAHGGIACHLSAAGTGLTGRRPRNGGARRSARFRSVFMSKGLALLLCRTVAVLSGCAT